MRFFMSNTVKILRTLLVSLILISGTTQAAGTFDLAKYKGEVVYLDFWASWCGPCAKSFPWMQAMHEKYAAKGLRIVAVTVDENPDDAKAFLEKNTASFDIVYDPEGKLAGEYGLIGMPTSLVFDREGKQISRHVSFREDHADEYEANLMKLLD